MPVTCLGLAFVAFGVLSVWHGRRITADARRPVAPWTAWVRPTTWRASACCWS